MAGKKDFSEINTGRATAANMGKVTASAGTATSRRGQQATVTEQEAAERAADLRTQGRKGCKAIRINMAFTPENHEFIKVCAKASGRTMTEYANFIIERFRKAHPEYMEGARAFIDQMTEAAEDVL